MVPGCLLLTLLSPLPPLPHPIRRRRCVRPRRYGRTAVDCADAGRARQDRGVSARNLTPHSTPEPYPLNPVPLSLFSQILNPDPCVSLPPRCSTIVLATPPLSLGESRKPDPCVSLPYSIRCSTIVLATPPRPDGTITPEVLYCAKKAGVTHILKAGGAQV